MPENHVSPQSILHVCARQIIRELRDRILRLEGYDVVSTSSHPEAIRQVAESSFNLVLVDVEGEDHVPQVEKLCTDIKDLSPGQKLAFVCNYQVSLHTDCPDEVIHAEFNPKVMLEGVKHLLAD